MQVRRGSHLRRFGESRGPEVTPSGPRRPRLSGTISPALLRGWPRGVDRLRNTGDRRTWPNHAVICVHSAPEPTADGIRSDASKRKVAFGLVRYCADNLSMPSVYRLWSTPLFAETQPGATWIRLSAHCGDDRYVCTACVAASLANATVNSPPPSTGVGTARVTGRQVEGPHLTGRGDRGALRPLCLVERRLLQEPALTLEDRLSRRPGTSSLRSS